MQKEQTLDEFTRSQMLQLVDMVDNASIIKFIDN